VTSIACGVVIVRDAVGIPAMKATMPSKRLFIETRALMWDE
jgi:hypothetical protein